MHACLVVAVDSSGDVRDGISWCLNAEGREAVSAGTIPASDEREPMSRAEDDAGREIAKELEQQHPRWIVIFGAFTREFVCLPRFAAPPGVKVVAPYPEAAAERMAKVERLYRIREGLREVGGRTDKT